MRLWDRQWKHWCQLALIVAYRLRPPEVCVVLDDGTPVPCTCTLRSVLPNGSLVWVARSASGAPLLAERVKHISGSIMEGDGLALEVLEADDGAFRCPRCGSVSHSPDDMREGYCGRCRTWTRRGGCKQ